MEFLEVPINQFKLQSGRTIAKRFDSLNKKSPATTYFPACAVSSAKEGLTSVFEMGTGITPPLWSPGIKNKLKGIVKLLQN